MLRIELHALWSCENDRIGFVGREAGSEEMEGLAKAVVAFFIPHFWPKKVGEIAPGMRPVRLDEQIGYEGHGFFEETDGSSGNGKFGGPQDLQIRHRSLPGCGLTRTPSITSAITSREGEICREVRAFTSSLFPIGIRSLFTKALFPTVSPVLACPTLRIPIREGLVNRNSSRGFFARVDPVENAERIPPQCLRRAFLPEQYTTFVYGSSIVLFSRPG